MTHRAKICAALVSALGLGACASGAKLRAPEVALPLAFEAKQAAAPAQNLDRWWDAFGDAQLTALVDEALDHAPDARAALARLAEARAIRFEATAGYNPQGALTGSAVDQHNNATISGVNVAGAGSSLAKLFLPQPETKTYASAFNVSWELDLFGRRRNAGKGADADLAAARFDYEASRLALAANVATTLFQARGLAVQLEDARETERIARELAVIADKKAERGLGSAADAARTEADAASAGAETARLQAASQAAKRTLLTLLGRGAAPLASLPIEAKTAPPPPPPAATPSDLLQRRPDVREAEFRLRSASRALQGAKLALFPTFTLLPTGSISRVESAYVQESRIWTIGAGASLPVLDRPRLLAVVRQQRAHGEQMVIAYEQAVQNAFRDAENGLVTADADQRRVALLTTAEAKARYAYDASRKGYEVGLVDLTTLLDAERSWRASRSALTSVQVGALTDTVSLYKALGGGWTPLSDAAAIRSQPQPHGQSQKQGQFEKQGQAEKQGWTP
jgi:NodT family efflux transporter outer membrane factor (OMF) lipoprotein